MAQIIMFPSGERQAEAQPPMQKRIASNPVSLNVVVALRGRKIPKKNRSEDDRTIMLADLARRYEARAYQLAQTEPNSESHRLALHMAGISSQLPCNNLRVLATADDLVLGLWRMWRRTSLLSLEWELCDARRLEAARDMDEEGRQHWSQAKDEAELRCWEMYERMISVPAASLREFQTYKLDRRLMRGVGRLEWLRAHKPRLAAILEEERERLESEKAARKALRSSKNGPTKVDSVP